MRTIIAGSRDIHNYEHFLEAMRLCPIAADITEVVCGCARGADMLGSRYAEDLSLPLKKFPADWDTHGKRAGVLRNVEMAEYADALIALWDGESVGTANMIKEAEKRGLRVFVIYY